MAAAALATGHYHATINSIGRGTNGAPVVAKAAYRAGECLFDERNGVWHDFTHKAGRVIEKHIELPTGAAAWGHDRNRLWNASEAAEPRKNGRNATELELALPHALTDQQRHDMLSAFVRQKVEKYGVVADVAVHFGRAGNIHAHVVLSHRQFGPDGFGEVSNARTVSKIVKGQLRQVTVYGLAANPDAVKELRREWADFQNAWFEPHSHRLSKNASHVARTVTKALVIKAAVDNDGWSPPMIDLKPMRTVVAPPSSAPAML